MSTIKPKAQKLAPVGWIIAADNAWGVPVLDVRPVTLNLMTLTKNTAHAINAVSYTSEDGTSFINAEPPISRTIKANLQFRIDRMLADGVLFRPTKMEEKWAIYYRQGRILCIRSWLRSLIVKAEVQTNKDYMTVTAIHGVFTDKKGEPDFTIGTLDYLLLSLILDIAYPALLPKDKLVVGSKNAALWCFSQFGNSDFFLPP